MEQTNEVTDEFLQQFKAGDLVHVKVTSHKWSGPYKLLVYRIERTKYAKTAAYMKADIGEKKPLERWLIEGDQQVIRKYYGQKNNA